MALRRRGRRRALLSSALLALAVAEPRRKPAPLVYLRAPEASPLRKPLAGSGVALFEPQADAERNATWILQQGEAHMLELASHDFQDAIDTWQFQNLLGSLKLFMRSAQRGYQVGEYCFRWGHYHELPPPDFQQALRWYKRGARMKHGNSLTALGKLLFAMGKLEEARAALLEMGRPRSYGGATGDSLAQWFLAEMSWKEENHRDAVRWWKRSAENGDVDAMMRLFSVFANGGIGIPKEGVRASHWLLAAAANGHQEALHKISWEAIQAAESADEPIALPRIEKEWLEDLRLRGWV